MQTQQKNILLENKRFQFWRVFWVVLAVFVFLMLIGLIASLTATASEGKPYQWAKIFSGPHMASQLISLIALSVYFYFTLNFYHRYFLNRKNFFSFLRLFLASSLLCAAFFIAKHRWLKIDSMENNIPDGMFYFTVVMYSLFYGGVSLLIAYLTYLRDEKKRQKVLEEQKLQLEIEKSSANLNFLKAQINPHFLHNTLNFLYAKSLPYSPELSEGILTLSDIMRYALSEGNARDGKAPLKDEIEHVWNVIKINQLRFSNTLNVEFTVRGLVDNVTIIPFVLITIVENSFKHGDLKNQQSPIEIKIDVQKNTLNFWCRNKKKSGPKELSTGVGLDNIRKRLDLAYGDHYHFNIKDDTDFYTTELTIDSL
jgi:two-component system LytT family sensor kinase